MTPSAASSGSRWTAASMSPVTRRCWRRPPGCCGNGRRSAGHPSRTGAAPRRDRPRLDPDPHAKRLVSRARGLHGGSPCPPPRGMMIPMPDVPVWLRPIEEADLESLRRFDIDPSSRGPYLTSGFRSPQARRRRWEEDGWLGTDSGQLAVTLPDGTLAGIVSWRSIPTGGPEVGCLEIGALLFPEHRGQGRGTAAQRGCGTTPTAKRAGSGPAPPAAAPAPAAGCPRARGAGVAPVAGTAAAG